MAMAILTVASVVGVLIILLVIIFALIRGLKKALKYAEANNSDGDDSVIDIIENIGPLKKMFSGRNRDFGTGYERRIRKQFYDKTRNAMKKGLPVGDSSTPGQIEAVLNAYGDEEISALREEYENVRYGQH